MNVLARASAPSFLPKSSFALDLPGHDRRSMNTTDGLVSVTAQAWGMGWREEPPRLPGHVAPPEVDDRAPDRGYASPALRDRFLGALDAGDAALAYRLAGDLSGCGNPLPGMTCLALQLPPGSTYGRAARQLLASALSRAVA